MLHVYIRRVALVVAAIVLIAALIFAV